jgi:NAD(P)-dependent dehydrogenase (short-subunit alcohol dehydrogenase family)
MTSKSVAVVTGASQGIGRAAALRLARDFSVIVLVARNKESLEKTAAGVRSIGAEAIIFALDLREPQSAKVPVSGSAALDPKPGFAAVASINAAINALAKAFAEQGIKDGVQVNSVVPGAVMTGRRQSFFEKWAPAHNLTVEDAIKKFPGEAGIARFGKPEEIADRLGYLVSPAAKWMTGASVRIDGGEIKGI